MEWILVAIVVFVLYNAEKLPDLMSKVKKDLPTLVETGKKVSHEIKEKTQTTAKKLKAEKFSHKETNKNKKED